MAELRAARPRRTLGRRSRPRARRTAATCTSRRRPTSRAIRTSRRCSARSRRARPATRSATSTFLAATGDPVTGEPVGSTEENLRSAIVGETYEYTEMYPGVRPHRRDEGFIEVAEWLETLARAEKSHAVRLAQGLESHLVSRGGSTARSGSRPALRSTVVVDVTTTYDPHHPQYLDDTDLRGELTRVYDLCHGCRLCSKLCTVVPDAVRAHRPATTTRTPAELTPATSRTGRRRVLPVQALLRQLPVHPWPERVGHRLPPADAAGRRRSATPSGEVPVTPPADRPTPWPAPTSSARSAPAWRRWRTPSPPSPGSLRAQGHGEDHRRLQRPAAPALRPAALLDLVPASARGSACTAARAGWRCSPAAWSSTRTRPSART